ncbi:MAG: DivIVA domain-containing protein [candidate division WOR-3 bacterium]|nr:DivIVA domain-containing protein [candidate division WOR-3 bacterium]
MPLTPIEIKNKNFSTAIGGFNKKEVKAFLAIVSKEIEELRNERASLAQKVDELSMRIAGIEKTEALLKETLMTAQKATSEIKDNAKKEAELIISKAKTEAENIKHHLQEQIQRMEKVIADLQVQKINLISQIKSMITNFSMLIEQMESKEKKS